MSFWSDLGFIENPYSTTPIPPTAEGERLLVGRGRELERLERLITSSASHPTIEGDNGVGKTSLVSVAGYRLMQTFVEGRSNQLFIPLGETFQLTPTDDIASFRRRIYFAVARTFIEHHTLITKRSLAAPDVDDVEKWLTAPLIRDRSGGGSVMGSGANYGQTTTINEAAGWEESGFQSTVEAWLADCFPSPEAGALIGVIDNLELLETSQKARVLLEGLRDSVLSRPGLRWVLCGARGIVRSAAASARLAGVLSTPLELGPITEGDIPTMIARRIETFAITPNAYVPVDAGGFTFIYNRLNRNLRDALNVSESYALQLDPGALPDNPQEELADWLVEEAMGSYSATRLSPRPWEVFDKLVVSGGSCSPSDFDSFGFNSSEAFRAPVKNLEDANLVMSTKADSDQRRKTIAITSRGWLVAWARDAQKENQRAAENAFAAEDEAGEPAEEPG